MEDTMHSIEGMTIEQLAELRDAVTVRLADRVATRQWELQAEQDRIGGLVEGRAPKVKKVKYRLDGHEWSGVGSMPKLVVDHLLGGGSLDQLKV
jgi:hypothetical protein